MRLPEEDLGLPLFEKRNRRVFLADAGRKPLLNTRTRPDAWQEWTVAAWQPPLSGKQQAFEHFFLQPSGRRSGSGRCREAIALVHDDLQSVLLAAPMGFVEDNSFYYLLSPTPIKPDSPEAKLLEWLREMGGSQRAGKAS